MLHTIGEIAAHLLLARHSGSGYRLRLYIASKSGKDTELRTILLTRRRSSLPLLIALVQTPHRFPTKRQHSAFANGIFHIAGTPVLRRQWSWNDHGSGNAAPCFAWFARSLRTQGARRGDCRHHVDRRDADADSGVYDHLPRRAVLLKLLYEVGQWSRRSSRSEHQRR